MCPAPKTHLRPLQFGDIAASSCVVTEWSDWTKCSAMALPGTSGATGGGQTLIVKTRTRTVRSGALAGCPDLQEVVECGAWAQRL